jgi:N-acetylglucosamine kinase-like BadF-type ATPase
MYVLGIDGGGTKTDCAVGTRTRILGRGTAGSCKLREVGPETALANLRTCVTDALRSAAIRGDQIAASSAAIAGASQPDVVDWVKRSLARFVSGRIEVVGDHVAAFTAAFPDDSPGILVISGTGSIAFGRNAHGKTARAGGHGPQNSDQGSGRWIGKLALDSGLLIDAAEVAADPASLFPAVLKLAADGNSEATDLLTRAGDELAKLAEQVARELALESPLVRIAGSVLQKSPAVQSVLHTALDHRCPGAHLDTTPIDVLEGALILARRIRAESVAN